MQALKWFGFRSDILKHTFLDSIVFTATIWTKNIEIYILNMHWQINFTFNGIAYRWLFTGNTFVPC